MKKTIFIIILMMVVMFGRAQKLDFAGIPLSGSIEQYEEKLSAKGYVLQSGIIGSRCYIGQFLNRKNANIVVWYKKDTREVYGAKAYIDDLVASKAEALYADFKNRIGKMYSSARLENGTDSRDLPTFMFRFADGSSIFGYMKQRGLNWSVNVEYHTEVYF